MENALTDALLSGRLGMHRKQEPQPMTKGNGSVVKLKWYEVNGKRCSKSTSGAVQVESPYFYILYYGRDGKQRREATGTADFDEAQRLLNRRTVHTEDGQTPVADLKSLRYEDLRADYVKAKPSRAQSEQYKLNPLDDFFKSLRIHDRRKVSARIQDYIEQRRNEDDAADPTIRRELVILRAMFYLAVENFKIGLNDMPNFNMPADSASAATYIHPADFAKVLASLPQSLRSFFTFMYATACRRGAGEGITFDMVSRDGTEIKIPAWLMKNGDPLTIQLAGDQLTPIAADLKRRMSHAFDKSEKVFDTTNYRVEWAKACAKAGLGTWDQKTRTRTGVRIHDCRGSAAANLVDAGVAEGTVMKIAGWKTRKMLDRYVQLTQNRARLAMEQAGRYVTEQQTVAQ
jgi:integrase